MFLSNYYGGDPEFLMVNLEITAREYLVSTGDAFYIDNSGVSVAWA